MLPTTYIMCFSQKQKRILGRLLEGMGVGIFAGVVLGVTTNFPMKSTLYWFYFFSGIFLILIGAWLYETNPSNTLVVTKKKSKHN